MPIRGRPVGRLLEPRPTRRLTDACPGRRRLGAIVIAREEDVMVRKLARAVFTGVGVLAGGCLLLVARAPKGLPAQEATSGPGADGRTTLLSAQAELILDSTGRILQSSAARRGAATSPQRR